ncbi:MAG: signal recognition particle-docking protein FtsY [Gammaproteobacteria bacterium]
MFTFGRKKTNEPASEQSEGKTSEDNQPDKKGFFQGLKDGLSRTRENMTGGISDLFHRGEKIDAQSLEELEDQLLISDVGIQATETIINGLRDRLKKQKLEDGQSLKMALRDQMLELLEPACQPLEIPDDLDGPFVLLMVGVNGAGKTTTIGKLTKRYQQQGLSVALAAGDTFRAAAVEQLQTWGERNNVTVIAHSNKEGGTADPASVIFDAVSSCKAKKIDVLIADTAGRLQTQSHLMEELRKIRRVISKVDETAPHEVMLVIDSTTGQNALNQAEKFNEVAGLTGLTLTKLDGTAKGGVIFALAEKFDLPIRYIGVGEQKEDLRIFDAKDFVDALLDMDGE